MKPLTVRQLEVLRRLAKGDVIMSCIHSTLADGTSYFWKGSGASGIDHVHANTVYALRDRKLMEVLKRDNLRGSDYRISRKGRKALKHAG